MTTMRELEQDIRQEAEECDLAPFGGMTHEAACDAAHELADCGIPVYTGDLMELAAQEIELATDEPELGPAFDGSPTPVNIVAANVFERLYAVAYEVLHERLDEEDDES